MRDPTVQRLPPSFLRYAGEPPQLAAGSPGKSGALELVFAPEHGQTRLISSFAYGPQRVGRALHPDALLPQMAYAIVQSVSGGVLQGDRLAIDVTALAGAVAQVTTQSATKIYRMEHNYATQRLSIRALSGAYLEFLPDYLVPYRGARFYQEIELDVAGDATVLLADAVAPGRTALGERFAYDLLYTRLTARDGSGALSLADTVILEPGRSAPGRVGLLGRHNALGTLYVLTRQCDAAGLATKLDAASQGVAGAEAGASTLPNDAGAVLRVAGECIGAVQAALHQGWRAARRAILGADVPPREALRYGTELALRPAAGCSEIPSAIPAPGSNL